jgi:NAD(P)-dependent dehydrogenase (short-subunit alcohol dehydrogenase family)
MIFVTSTAGPWTAADPHPIFRSEGGSVMSEPSFKDRVALVTGGASGIGEACVMTFARGGAKVAVVDLNADLGAKTVAAVKDAGSDAIFLEVDVAKPEAVERMVADTVKQFGSLDIAVNNAGISGETRPTGEYSIDNWRKVIDVNLSSVFYCMHFEIKQMLKQGGGAIVNMASILGSVGFANSPAYVAAKHGVVGLTKSAALEYAKQGIRINSVGPAFIKTPLLNALDEQTMAQLDAMHALGRMGKPKEVGDLVGFLCSEEASFLTGAYYLADGGYTAQ